MWRKRKQHIKMKKILFIIVISIFCGVLRAEPLPAPAPEPVPEPEPLADPQQYPQQYPPGAIPIPGYNYNQGQQQGYPAPPPPPPAFAVEGKSCLHTFECDAGNTVMSCERGKCTCPSRPTLQWTRGPYPLNTAWDNGLRKCLSVKDSACDMFNPKTVYCTTGLVCKASSAKDGFGLCASFGNKLHKDMAIFSAGLAVASILSFRIYF